MALNKADLVKRLEALEAEKQIRETLHNYSHTIDYGPGERWANAVFTSDGVFDVFTVDGRPIHKENGRAELDAYLETKKLPPVQYDKHLIFSPLIAVDGDEATVESYFVCFDDISDQPRIFVFGRYSDKLVKENGRWLFKERLAETEVTGPHRRRPVTEKAE